MLDVVMVVCGSEQYVARSARHSFGAKPRSMDVFLMVLVWDINISTVEASDLFPFGCTTP
jgi:hypothetical protein